MRKQQRIALGLIILSFIIGIYFYPQMPAKIASHWNAQGQVDGYMAKSWGLFLVPISSLALFLIFLAIPKIDPLKSNIEKFLKYYDGLLVLIIMFLLYVQVLTILWNIGIRFSMIQLLSPAMGILFYYLGILIENAKRNWFIGIRTPWTLSSDRVWRETHRIGGKLFKISGIIAVIGVFFPTYAVLFIIVPVLLSSVYLIIYSYVEFRKQPD